MKASTESDTSPSPTPPSERNISLDALRGFALLGILVINIQTFSMPFEALTNPTLYGGFEGSDYATWLFGHVFFQGSFITLFTMIFGGGVILFSENKGTQKNPVAVLYYRRNFWLLIIGVVHAYLLWYGDILVMYALCAFFVFWMRDHKPTKQAVYGVFLLVVPATVYTLAGPGTSAELWNPSAEAIENQVAVYKGGWLAQMEHRIPTALSQHSSNFILGHFWRISGLMILGMAVFRWGLLTNERSPREYASVLFAGFCTGVPVVLAGVWYISSNNWSGEVGLWWLLFNYWGSILVAFGHIGGVMLYIKSYTESIVTRGLAAVGRTAFSNYLLQTVIATTIFYGHGVGMFGNVSRSEQLGIVVLIWAIQVPVSVLWLRRFNFGPVEWLWRTLTYGERQQMN